MSTAAAASGLLAGDATACIVASATGILALLAGWRAGAEWCPATGPVGARRRADLGSTALFRAFRGDEARAAGVHDADERDDRSPVPSPEPPEESGEAARADDEPDAAYEEFAAGLEDGVTEEISFLPPYVSGGDATEAEDDDEDDWDPPTVESPLLQELNEVLDPSSRMPMPRRFALGTVAILRNLLDPDQVSRILEEQRRYPRLRFGDIAVELGLLSREQRDELVRAQQEGVFSDEEIRDAKRRLEFHYSRRGRG